MLTTSHNESPLLHPGTARFMLLIAATYSFLLLAHAQKQPTLATEKHVSARCMPHERDALLAFKHGITNDSTNLLASWIPGRDCCRWIGITCSGQTGRVVKLDLNGAFSFYPPLVGQISPSLLSLDYLEYLDLSSNSLEGPNGTVPEFLGSMKSLRHLDLSYVPFSGRLPSLFGNLTNLEHLDLSFTTFLGAEVPPQLGNLSKLLYLDLSWMDSVESTDISWIRDLNKLEYINLSNISLSSIVELPVVVNMIPTLKHIILINCSLPSANQSITHLNLTELEDLDLSGNYFGHSIAPCWFWNVTSMKSLHLYETYLHGPFPDALGGMVSLQHLDFSNNGNAATLTVDLKSLCELETLYLDNSLSSGNITEFVDRLPQCASRKLSVLSSPSNNMTGIFPNTMKHLTSLITLILTNNSITGAVPPGISNCTRLEYFHFSSNRLSGLVPSLPRSLRIFEVHMNFLSGHLPLEIGAPNLKNLILSFNYITGKVPRSICESQNMTFLDLSNNLFEGELPHCSRMPNLRLLLTSNNSFSGEFPSWIQSMSSLVFLDLSWNKLYGSLPGWIGDLVNLRILHLSHNKFDGDIPVNITNLTRLQYLNLAANNISGSIPPSLSNLVGMTLKYPSGSSDDDSYSLAFDESKDLFSLVMKNEVLEYGARGLVALIGIDLSLNQLTGRIPNEVTSLSILSSLNLSCNQLSGKIPDNIGSMTSMESLDLSRNNFSGEIPPSLSNLTYLSYLDLSYNNLTGTIPSGRQLDTLYMEKPSMYNGNNDLCGPPLQRNCSEKNTPEHRSRQQESENDSDNVIFYYGLELGFVVVVWVVFYVLVFKRTWRVAYFRLLDLFCDNLYMCAVLIWCILARRKTKD
jgi:Leucine-rich repeat (LRR) protein